MHATEDTATSERTRQTERTRAVLTTYLNAVVERGDYDRFFSDDVTFTVMDTGEVTHGREAVTGLINYLHTQAFDATPVVRTVIVDGTQAVLEAEFVGRHFRDFAGIQPTGRDVSLPYSVAYDLDGDHITALRAYISMDVLVRQIREG